MINFFFNIFFSVGFIKEETRPSADCHRAVWVLAMRPQADNAQGLPKTLRESCSFNRNRRQTDWHLLDLSWDLWAFYTVSVLLGFSLIVSNQLELWDFLLLLDFRDLAPLTRIEIQTAFHKLLEQTYLLHLTNNIAEAWNTFYDKNFHY